MVLNVVCVASAVFGPRLVCGPIHPFGIPLEMDLSSLCIPTAWADAGFQCILKNGFLSIESCAPVRHPASCPPGLCAADRMLQACFDSWKTVPTAIADSEYTRSKTESYQPRSFSRVCLMQQLQRRTRLTIPAGFTLKGFKERRNRQRPFHSGARDRYT